MRFFNNDKKSKRLVWFLIYILYISFILISASAYFAEEQINEQTANSKSYVLTFESDGSVEHYSVKLWEPDVQGRIWVNYDAQEHYLDVRTHNIKELKIDCKSIAEEKTKEILDIELTGSEEEYKQYFIEKNKLTVNVDNDHEIDLTIDHVPYPSRVILNNQPLIPDQDYIITGGSISTKIPKDGGYVSIYFSDTATDLRADFKTDNNRLHHLPNHEINFDASFSVGKIDDYLWDFGDGTNGEGVLEIHQYDSQGYYQVTLVVRNENGLINRITKELSVFDDNSNGLPDDWEMLFQVNDPANDDDTDGLTNLEEYKANTNPLKKDTDGDGTTDDLEISKGTDPINKDDFPNVEKKKAIENNFPYWMIYIMSFIIIIVIVTITLIFYLKSKKEKELKISNKTNLPIRRPPKQKIIKKPFVHSTLPSEVYNSEILLIQQGDQQLSQKYLDQQSLKIGAEQQNPKIEQDQKDQSVFHQMHQPDQSPQVDQPSQPHQPQPAPLPLRPIFPGPRGSETKQLNNKMIDTDLKLPIQNKCNYECPTCNSSVGEECLKCPKCGEEFEE